MENGVPLHIAVCLLTLLVLMGCGRATASGSALPGDPGPAADRRAEEPTPSSDHPTAMLPAQALAAPVRSSSDASSVPPTEGNAIDGAQTTHTPGRLAPEPPAMVIGTSEIVPTSPTSISLPDANTRPDQVSPIQPTQWLTYTDRLGDFSIMYPDTYVVLDQANPRAPERPGFLYEVRFQDQQLATAPVADLELPQFHIEVFDNAASKTLDQWLNDRAMSNSRAVVQIGGQEGLRVSTNTMMAPNQFYYIAHGSVIYKLTPLGSYSEQMVDSFRLR